MAYAITSASSSTSTSSQSKLEESVSNPTPAIHERLPARQKIPAGRSCFCVRARMGPAPHVSSEQPETYPSSLRRWTVGSSSGGRNYQAAWSRCCMGRAHSGDWLARFG